MADPQMLGVDAVKGSQMIFPVVFKTRATQQYGPMREFQRRVRLALEEHHLLPGDPIACSLRLRPSGKARFAQGAAPAADETAEAGPAHDPTTIKPQETNPFSGEQQPPIASAAMGCG